MLVTQVNTTEAWMTAGRSQHFLDDTMEPYGLYAYSALNYVPTTTTVRSIAGEPPQAFPNASEGEFLAYALGTTNEPRVGLGNSEAVWTATPMLHTVDDASPLSKGAIGVCSNFWSMTNQTTGIASPTEFEVTGTGERYLAFGGSASLVIRKS